MRIMMLPCHEVLEADELRLLRSLGHDVFSPGSFVEPANRGDQNLRPTIAGLANEPEDVRLYHACAVDGRDNKSNLSHELVARFQVLIFMHMPEWVISNWPVLRPFIQRGGRVIWRTIGQAVSHQEAQLAPLRAEGLQIVRYSPAEERIPGYIGAGAMIRFYKDPSEWCGWTGETKRVLHIGQDVIKRREHCSYDFYEQMTRPFLRTLIGNGSEVVPWGRGRVSFDDMRAALRDHRCFFYTGTHPASYTLGFIEAMMTGIPVVASGPNNGNNLRAFPGHALYEVDSLLDGTNGLASDDPFEIQEYITNLMLDRTYAANVGAKGRELAIRLFGVETIRAQWAKFLGAA